MKTVADFHLALWRNLPTLTLLSITVYLTSALTMRAQDSTFYSASLSNPNSGAYGDAEFYLLGDTLTYSLVTIPGYSEAEIRGPGETLDAPLLFALNLTKCEINPIPDPVRGCFFDGIATLASDQIEDLNDGDLYVWARSPLSQNTISGQIVPEPSAYSFLLPGLVALIIIRKFRMPG